MKNYLIFAGTSEGRKLIEYILKNKPKTKITACTATEYGKMLLPIHNNLTIISKRLDEEDILNVIKNNSFDAIFDTTHPYAVIISENIQNAAKRANIKYYRILRKEEAYNDGNNIINVNSVEEAITYLASTEGNILSTIGSKELPKFCNLPNFKERVYARILPNPKMVSDCFDMGFQGQHLICIQGPFSEEFNTALIHQFNILYMITKSSGKAGGFLEKVKSAKNTNTKLIVINRPIIETGYFLDEIYKML